MYSCSPGRGKAPQWAWEALCPTAPWTQQAQVLAYLPWAGSILKGLDPEVGTGYLGLSCLCYVIPRLILVSPPLYPGHHVFIRKMRPTVACPPPRSVVRRAQLGSVWVPPGTQWAQFYHSLHDYLLQAIWMSLSPRHGSLARQPLLQKCSLLMPPAQGQPTPLPLPHPFSALHS